MGSLSIFQDGEETYQHTFGFVDVDQEISANASTKYRVGSISKIFTAAIILQLVDESKLGLNTNLSDFFPEIPNSSEISIEQLLRQRSGLFNFTFAPDYSTSMEQAISKEELLDRF